jgi:hypothetical protein
MTLTQALLITRIPLNIIPAGSPESRVQSVNLGVFHTPPSSIVVVRTAIITDQLTMDTIPHRMANSATPLVALRAVTIDVPILPLEQPISRETRAPLVDTARITVVGCIPLTTAVSIASV